MNRLYALFFPVVGVAIWTLIPRSTHHTLFRQLPGSETGITFNNRIQESDSVNVLQFEYLYNGGGVGIGDFNNDGQQDIFFTGNQVSCRLYLNQGRPGKSFQFSDVTEQAGLKTGVWCTGVTVVDINGDGWQDIYVSVAGFVSDTTKRANLLFVNETGKTGNPVRFSEQAEAYGLNDMGYSTQTAFFDYDHDGDLDAYVLTNALDRFNRNALRPKRLNGEAPSTDRLYKNLWMEQRGKNGNVPADHPCFINVSSQAGILTEGYGLGIAVSDLNGDGWEDIYCANDFLSNDLIWINNRNGTFSEKAAGYLKHQTHNAMGVDIADINQDGQPEIMVVDMLPNTNERQKMMLPGYNYDRFRMDLQMGYQLQYMRNTLQLGMGYTMQTGNGKTPLYADVSQLAGVDKTDWSWAPLLADFDNDGFRDLLITNGYRRDVTNLDFTAYLADLNAGGFGDMAGKNVKAYRKLLELPTVKLPDFCYRNQGATGDLSFEDVTSAWGFEAPNYSNGAAYADLDNDGDLDIVINAIDDEAFVYENTLVNPVAAADTTHWIRFGFGSAVAQGTRIRLWHDGQKQFAEFNPTRGYVSSVEPFLHFGLGRSERADSVVIIRPDGKSIRMIDLPADQLIRIPDKAEWLDCDKQCDELPDFVPVSVTDLDVTHTESEFNDFARTPLLPHKHSQNGPSLAIADVNGDGLEDVFMGADFGQPAYVFVQHQDGRFLKKRIHKQDDQEDVAALFFDADNDHDLDLYVVSGGSHRDGRSDAYQDRLYLNDGKGNFCQAVSALPVIDISGSCITACDIDQDGDLDLFRGSRLMPGAYPMPVKSYLLINERGRFTDQTAWLAPDLLAAGMVTTAVWADVDNDHLTDLMLAGEWMPVVKLKGSRQTGKGVIFRKDRFLVTSKPIQGWWNKLIAFDFDQDGDLDLMGGNLGLNTKYKATESEPVELFAADFDKNGQIDPIITHYLNHRRWIRQTRDLLTFQIPSMKKRFPDFITYAQSTFDESFTAEELKPALHLTANEFRSMYFENTGHGFRAKPLPQLAQLSSVYDFLVGDFNHDAFPDVLLVGNSYAPETIGGWQDAGKGLLLTGNGKGHFKAGMATGFVADLDAKALKNLKLADGTRCILVGNNGSRLQLFRPVQKKNAGL